MIASVLLSFIPSSWLKGVIDLTLILGIVAVMGGEVFRFVPQSDPYLKLVRVIGYVMIIVGVYFEGSYATEMMWRMKAEELQQRVEIAEKRAKEANAQIKTEIVTKYKTIHDTKVITKTVLQKEKEMIDADCKVSQNALDIINAAAKGEVPAK